MSRLICHISTAHVGFDIRIFHKECVSIANQAGYECVLIIPHTENVVREKVRLFALPIQESRLKRFLLNGALAFQKALKANAQIYHFHDPEFIPYALLLKLFGKKVVYDIHENLPQDILTKEWIGNENLRKFVASIAVGVEKLGNLFFNGIVTVNQEIAERFNPAKTIIASNLPIISKIDSIPIAADKKIRPIIIYTGAITKIRGIKEMMLAMNNVPTAEMWIMGSWDDAEFQAECIDLAISNVKILTSQSLEVAYSYVKMADIGIVNYLPLQNHLNSMPNKPFEYMTCGLPIVVSNFDSWKGLFTGCALFVNPTSPSDIAEKINTLLNNPGLSKQLGENGRLKIEQEYSWEAESKKLFQLYNKILSN